MALLPSSSEKKKTCTVVDEKSRTLWEHKSHLFLARRTPIRPTPRESISRMVREVPRMVPTQGVPNCSNFDAPCTMQSVSAEKNVRAEPLECVSVRTSASIFKTVSLCPRSKRKLYCFGPSVVTHSVNLTGT